MLRELCAELLADVVERTPHCRDTACTIAFRARRSWIDIEHVDATQDHPFGAVRTVSLDTFNRTRRGDLLAQLVHWLEQVHPVPNVKLVA